MAYNNKEQRNIVYSHIIVWYTTAKRKHQHKITERKEGPNPTMTRKAQNKNHIIQHAWTTTAKNMRRPI
jgi:hypothetical protein